MNTIKAKHTKGFTLLEVLISIGLLGIVIVALFSTVSMMKDSNSQLLDYLEKAKKITKATKVLYLDIISSDGDITIKKDDFTRLCMEKTKNSLYSLPTAKVCWVVLKKDNTLVRVEGNKYHLPTKMDEKVEVNSVMKHVELFDVYHKKDKVLVFLKRTGKKPITFMIQGILNPVLKTLPDGTKIMKDGSKILPDGTIVPAPKKGKSTKSKASQKSPITPRDGAVIPKTKLPSST